MNQSVVNGVLAATAYCWVLSENGRVYLMGFHGNMMRDDEGITGNSASSSLVAMIHTGDREYD